MSRRDCISRALAALGVAACYEAAPPDDHGLEAVRLRVEPADVARLRAGTFTDTPVVATVELRGVDQVAELSVAGRTSVDDFKKSFNLDLDAGRVRLNAMSRDRSATRGYLAWQIYAAAGFATPDLRHASVFLNGEYLGLYLVHETIDADFFTDRGEVPLAIYAARDSRATMEHSGDVERAFSSRLEPDVYSDLERLVALINAPPTPGNRRELGRLLDVASVARYMAATRYSDNRDGIDNNFVLYRTRRDPRFAIVPWDLDFSLWFVGKPTDGALFDGNAMMRRLWKEPRARRSYLCTLVGLRESAGAGSLNRQLDDLAAHIGEAWRADRFLAAGDESLDEQVAAIRARNVAQEKALDSLPPCPIEGRAPLAGREAN